MFDLTCFDGNWFLFFGKDIYKSTDGQSWDKITVDLLYCPE